MKRLSALLALTLTVSAWADSGSSVPQPLAGRIIVVDPGHAVKDASERIINQGAMGRHRTLEDNVVLDVADKLRPLLEAQGAKVYMTRTRNNPWRYTAQGRHADNRSRALFANTLRADVYVRLHCDARRNRKVKGFTVYYFRWGSRRLARSIDQAFAAALPDHPNNGLHRRTFVSVTSTMPTVLLEMGFLTNKIEVKDLASDSYQTRLSQAISAGLVNYFSMSHT